jgi:hypothetical protein
VSFNSELTRKLETVMERWVTNHTQGKITDRELYILTSALWDTCSGLTQEQPLRLLEQINKELRLKMKAERSKA